MNKQQLVIEMPSNKGFREVDNSNCYGFFRISGLWVIYSKLAKRISDMICRADYISDDLQQMILQVCELHDAIRSCIPIFYQTIFCSYGDNVSDCWDDYLGDIYINLIRIAEIQIENEEKLSENSLRLISLVKEVSDRLAFKIYAASDEKRKT